MEEEEEEGLNLQRRTRADLVRLSVRGEGGDSKMQSSRPRVRPNTKIYSSSDVCLSPRQRTQRPWNDLSLMLLLHRLISATLHSQLQQRMLGGQAGSIYSQAVLEFQESHGMSGKFRGYWGNGRQSFFFIWPRLEKPCEAETNKTCCDNHFLYINSLIKKMMFKRAAAND